MSDNKKEWTRAEVTDLIACYEQHPCLWNVLSNEYKNKIIKSDAFKKLSEKFGTSVEEITRKIHNLRNQFNTELKKINSKKSGQGSDDNYETKWPYFKNLLFIKTSLQTRQTTGNMVSTYVIFCKYVVLWATYRFFSFFTYICTAKELLRLVN